MDDSTRSLWIVVGVFLVVILVLSTLTGGMMGGPMFGPGTIQGPGWMWGLGMGLGGLTMVLFWGVLVVGIILLVRYLGNSGSLPSQAHPLDILKRRYAAGEITRDQYEQIRHDLESTSR